VFYAPFNIEVVDLKVLITLNMITYAHILFISEFKPNLQRNIYQQQYKSSN